MSECDWRRRSRNASRRYSRDVPATIRIRVDPITADLAAERLREEGIPAQVVSDSDMIGVAGTPMHFSLVVPAGYEELARKILTAINRPRSERR